MNSRLTRLVGSTLVALIAIVGVSSTASAKTSAKQVPDPNGTLNWEEAASTVQPTYNIHTYAGGLTGFWIYTNFYDSLLQLNAKGQLEPMLATSWKFNSTSTQLTLQLRKGVKFQDGEAFNADDAAANIQADTAAGSNSASAFSRMTSVIAVNPFEIQMTFSTPDPSILYDMVGYSGMMIAPKGLANPSMLTTTPMGSGPYELQSVTSSVTYQEVYWSGYWNKSHVFPKYYNQQNIPTETTRLAAIETGVSDGGYITALTYPTVKSNPAYQVVPYHSPESYNVYMNTNIAPLNNPQVREAISMAIDRQAVDASQDGLCPPAYQAFGPNMVGYIKGYTGLGYNPTKAKQLIQAAGATGASVVLDTTIAVPFPAISQIIQSELDGIGLNVSIDQLVGTSFRTQYIEGQFAMLMAPDSLTAPDPSSVVDNFYTGSQNPGTKDPVMVAQINSAESLLLGSATAHTTFEAVNKALTTTYLAWAPICYETNIFVANKSVLGVNDLPFGILTAGPDGEYLQIAK